MNDPVYQELLEASWRRKLTPDEQAQLQAYLSVHPDAGANWRGEATLNELLRALPEAPVASNFTSQVLRAVESEQRHRAQRSSLAAWWEDWRTVLWPKLAWACLALLLGLAAIQEYRYLHRNRIARDLAKIPVVPALPPPEILQDFEPIQELSRFTSASNGAQTVSDEALLIALQ